MIWFRNGQPLINDRLGIGIIVPAAVALVVGKGKKDAGGRAGAGPAVIAVAGHPAGGVPRGVAGDHAHHGITPPQGRRSVPILRRTVLLPAPQFRDRVRRRRRCA